jgi:hypothetical protein
MKHLLHGAALVTLFAIFAPTWAQAPGNAPSTTPPPTSSAKVPPGGAAPSAQAPAASDRATAAASANAGNWVQPRPRRHTRRIRRYARYGYPYYGYPYYGYYRWGSPSDHVANQLNAQQLYGGGWGWGGGPYSRMPYSPYGY